MGILREERNEDVEEFWNEVEEELGTPVLGRTLGRVVTDPRPGAASEWGLFYTTVNAIYFRTFPQDNWFTNIIKNTRMGKRKKEEDRERVLEIPAGEIEELLVDRPKGLWGRLFQRPPVVEVKWRPTGASDGRQLRFEIDGKSDPFLSTLPDRSASS